MAGAAHVTTEVPAIQPRLPTARTIDARSKVFVGYSHRDRDLFGELQVQLKPLQRAWLLDLWDDERVVAGARGRRQLHAAIDSARLVVLLISPGFFSSPFISVHGLPALLGGRGRTAADVMCLYLRPSMEAFETFVYEGLGGVVRQVRITDFHGLNDPVRPLAALDADARARVLARAGASIIKTVRPELLPVA
jgi:hypothetical protein